MSHCAHAVKRSWSHQRFVLSSTQALDMGLSIGMNLGLNLNMSQGFGQSPSICLSIGLIRLSSLVEGGDKYRLESKFQILRIHHPFDREFIFE